MNTLRYLAGSAGCVLMSVLGAGPLAAQVSVFPVQDLSFGQLRPGVSEQVSTDDAQRRAELDVIGTGRLVMTLALPAELVSTDGHRIPLTFRNKDAKVVYRSSGQERNFHPTKPTEVNVSDSEGGVAIYLGGLAAPALSSPPGVYTAKVTIQVAAPGT